VKDEPKKLWYEYRISKDFAREGYFYGPGAPSHLIGQPVVFGSERKPDADVRVRMQVLQSPVRSGTVDQGQAAD
jgi:hypothetical protein